MTNEDLTNFVKKFVIAASYMSDEEVDCFYDSKNLDAFMFPINVMSEEYPLKSTYLLHFIEKKLDNWRTRQAQCPQDHFVYENQTISDNTFCEVSKRKYNNRNSLCFVVDTGALKLEIDSKNYKVSCNSKETLFKVIRCDAYVLLTFLRNKGIIERIYLPNTAKHGENGLGGLQADSASSLRCSDSKAKRMMSKAIRVGKNLYYYDKEESLYIRFMSGGNNTFHPYHIESFKAEEKNIPPRAKEILKKLFGDIKPSYE